MQIYESSQNITMNKSSFIIIFLFVAVASISGRVLNQCQLAVEFAAAGIQKEIYLPNYVCIAQHESRGNTSAIRGPGKDGSYDWGLFLVSDNYWCGRNSAVKGCNIKCGDLLSDNISAAVQCAETIVEIHGFNAWESWGMFCRNNLPDLSHCFK